MTSIAKEPYNCLILQGVQTPVPYPLPPPPSNYRELTLFLEPNETAHKILDSFCTCRIYKHQRHSLTVYISLREVSFPCPFICWYCFFYLLCLTYFTEGGGAGSNLSILKVAKKNYMGRFIFSRGVGSICLFLCQKNTQYLGGYI